MEKIEVRVGCLTGNGASPSIRFKVNIDVGNGLTQRERAILFNSARNCEVGKILAGPIDIEYAQNSFASLNQAVVEAIANGKDRPTKRFE